MTSRRNGEKDASFNDQATIAVADSSGNGGACYEASPLLLPPRSGSEVMSSWPPQESAVAILNRSRKLLYLSHLFSQFSEIAWQFCLILFLAAFSNYQSLILVSSYGLVSELSVCLFGSAAGRFVDSANRLFVAQRFIWTENLAVLLATLFCYLLLVNTTEAQENNGYSSDNLVNGQGGGIQYERFQGIPTDPWSIFLLIGIHVLGATAKILDRGFLVAMERDWIVVMSRYPLNRGDLSEGEQVNLQKQWLSTTNVAMKQIDLSCKVAAPAVAGYLIAMLDDGTDPHHRSHLRGAALFLGLLNGMALVVEYICTAMIYRQIPGLAIKSPANHDRNNSNNNNTHEDTDTTASSDTDEEHASTPSIVETPPPSGGRAEKTTGICSSCQLPEGLQVFLDQSVSWAGIALSLLYLNVLTFGGIMTAYLVWRGMRLDAIGVWRGLSSAVGLAGTFVYHISSRNLSLASTGMWSIIFQFFCLSLSYVSLFIDDYDTSMTMLIAGVCASRVGLWVFDISVTQLMQDYVSDGVRGLVGGVQNSLNSFFFLLSFGIGIILPDPQDFHVYVAAGYVSVAVAVLCFYFGVFNRRNKFGSIVS